MILNSKGKPARPIVGHKYYERVMLRDSKAMLRLNECVSRQIYLSPSVRAKMPAREGCVIKFDMMPRGQRSE